MSDIIPIDQKKDLAERFWGIARSMVASGRLPESNEPVAVVRHVLAILDALERGEEGGDVSVHTLSFLQLLRESEHKGDLTYASPEQIRGETLDERSLVFSVGVLLFERLTGRHPFGAEGNAHRRVARIRKGELGSGVNYFPTVPSGLRSVLMRAMGPFREERFSTLAELRARLEQFVNDQAPAPRLPGTGAPDAKPSAHIDSSVMGRASARYARDIMAAAEVHNAHVMARRRKAEALEQLRHNLVARESAGTASRSHEPQAPVREERSEIIVLEPSMAKHRAGDAEPHMSAPQAWEAPAPERGELHAVHHGAAGMAAGDDEFSRAVTLPIERQPPPGKRAFGRLPVSVPGHVSASVSEGLPASALATMPAPGPSLPGRAPVQNMARPAMKRDALLGRLLWLASGAALAVAIMLIAWPTRSVPRADIPAPAALPVPRPEAAPAAPAATAATAAPTQPAEPEPELEPAPSVFDPAFGGRQAAELAAPCFTPARLQAGVSFRAGLFYRAREGGVSKIYFAPTQELTVEERLCVKSKITGMIAGAPPAKGLVVDYQIRLSHKGHEALIK